MKLETVLFTEMKSRSIARLRIIRIESKDRICETGKFLAGIFAPHYHSAAIVAGLALFEAEIRCADELHLAVQALPIRHPARLV